MTSLRALPVTTSLSINENKVLSLVHTWRNSDRYYDQKYRSVIEFSIVLMVSGWMIWSPILPEIQPITIDNNNNGPLLNIGLNFVMCELFLSEHKSANDLQGLFIFTTLTSCEYFWWLCHSMLLSCSLSINVK